MRERGIDEGGEQIADWLEHLQYQSEVKTPDEDKPWVYKVIYWWPNQQNLNLLVCMMEMCMSLLVYVCI